jgi:hypothetical protein
MADFALWSAAAAPALGFQSETFIGGYMGNRESANALTLESSSVAQALLKLEEGEEWEDTATNHLERLNGMVKEATQRDKSWPKSGRALGGALRRLAPNLKKAGVVVEFKEKRQPKTGARLISIRKGGEICLTPVTSVTPVSEKGDDRPPGVTMFASPLGAYRHPQSCSG